MRRFVVVIAVAFSLIASVAMAKGAEEEKMDLILQGSDPTPVLSSLGYFLSGSGVRVCYLGVKETEDEGVYAIRTSPDVKKCKSIAFRYKVVGSSVSDAKGYLLVAPSGKNGDDLYFLREYEVEEQSLQEESESAEEATVASEPEETNPVVETAPVAPMVEKPASKPATPASVWKYHGVQEKALVYLSNYGFVVDESSGGNIPGHPGWTGICAPQDYSTPADQAGTFRLNLQYKKCNWGGKGEPGHNGFTAKEKGGREVALVVGPVKDSFHVYIKTSSSASRSNESDPVVTEQKPEEEKAATATAQPEIVQASPILICTELLRALASTSETNQALSYASSVKQETVFAFQSADAQRRVLGVIADPKKNLYSFFGATALGEDLLPVCSFNLKEIKLEQLRIKAEAISASDEVGAHFTYKVREEISVLSEVKERTESASGKLLKIYFVEGGKVVLEVERKKAEPFMIPVCNLTDVRGKTEARETVLSLYDASGCPPMTSGKKTKRVIED